ncbi:MAG: hypothetical protein IKR44_05605 [Bacteroidales bacterium]|nr:hypothetical protein [Bacteroidales bacterium]
MVQRNDLLPGTTATLGSLRGGTGAKRAVGPRSGGSGRRSLLETRR